MSLTLLDVARRANVSVSTVSRVLNNYPYVDSITRKTVWRVAQELGYPRDNLRRLNKPSPVVLLLVRVHDNQMSAETLASMDRLMSIGACSVFEKTSTNVLVQHSYIELEDAHTYAGDPNVAGLILLGGIVNREFVRNLQALGLPFVVAGAHVRPLQVNCVTADYRDGIEQAVTHLIGKARRSIGLVNGPTTTTSSEEKLKGYCLALCKHGIEVQDDHIVVSDFTLANGYEQTIRLLAQAPDLDAIVYADDHMAMGGLHALKEQDRHVPNDVAVTGFYGYDLGSYCNPPLTTVSFDMQAMGTAAARRLCMLLDDPDELPWQIVLPTSLIVREST